MTNADRADRAQAALDAYIEFTGDQPDESHFRDLLTDLMHLAARDGAGVHFDSDEDLTFDEALASTRITFAFEVASQENA